MAASGCTQPHIRLVSKIAESTCFRTQSRLTSNSGEWGGWDSNPGPADYESSPPAGLVRLADLGR